jgi:hypothetical protein
MTLLTRIMHTAAGANTRLFRAVGERSGRGGGGVRPARGSVRSSHPDNGSSLLPAGIRRG